MIYNLHAVYTHAVRKKMFQAALSLLCLFGLFFSLPVFSASETKQEPIIDEIVISTTSGHLLLFATVTHCFTDEMLEGVRNGLKHFVGKTMSNSCKKE